MSSGSKSSSAPWVPLILLLISGSSALYYNTQVKSSRPGFEQDDAAMTPTLLQVSARQWEDPIGVVEEALRNNSEEMNAYVDQLYARELVNVITLTEANASPMFEFLEETEELDWALRLPKGAPSEKVLPLEDYSEVIVLPTMVSENNYAEDVEKRIRTRYAVASAMYTKGFSSLAGGKLGFLPYIVDDVLDPAVERHAKNLTEIAKKILKTGEEEKQEERTSTYDQDNRYKDAFKNEIDRMHEDLAPQFKFIPYEMFDRRSPDSEKRTLALVLWIDEEFVSSPMMSDHAEGDRVHGSEYESHPYHIVHDIADEALEILWHVEEAASIDSMSPEPNFKLRIIGPSGSGVLSKIVTEFKRDGEKEEDASVIGEHSHGDHHVNHIDRFGSCEIFSPWATVDAKYLVGGQISPAEKSYDLHRDWTYRWDDGVLEETFLDGDGIEFDRIGSDVQLVHTLIDEMWRRNIYLIPHDPDCRRKNTSQKTEEEDGIHRAHEAKFDDNKAGDDYDCTECTESNPFTAPEFCEAPQHIVLLTEADTLYGRSMVDSFESAVIERGGISERIHSYTYLRGLDGTTQSIVSRSAAPVVATGPDGALGNGGGTQIAPTGGKQTDYIQRLVHTISALRRELMDMGDGHQLSAIGIVGNDQYDKLILIQSLRKTFSDCVFFTTDLDSAFTTKNEYPYTRNVLVASHFGFSLRKELQQETLPFRSNYQTAIYYGTFNALSGPNEPMSYARGAPRIFEIGRSKPINLTPADEIDSIHPDSDFVRPMIFSKEFMWSTIGIYLLLVSIVFMFSYTLRMPFRKGPGKEPFYNDCEQWWSGDPQKDYYIPLGITRDYRGATHYVQRAGRFIVALILSYTAVIAFVVYYANGDLNSGLGEPFFFSEGVSMWPVAIIRFLAAVTAVFLIIKIQQFDLARQRLKIMSAYGAALSRDALRTGAKNLSNSSIKSVLNWYFMGSLFFRKNQPAFEPDDRRAFLKSRFFRASGIFVVYLLIYKFAEKYGFYFSPIRGDRSIFLESMGKVLTTLATLFLVACVLDVTFHCRSLIKRLNNVLESEDWFDTDARRKNINRAVWVTEITASETHVAGRMVYYSFGLMFVTLLARSDAFDFYNWPIVVVFLLGLVVSTHLGGLAILYAAARQIKALAIQVLQTIHEDSRSDGDDDFRGHVEDRLKYVRNIQDGAFQPVLQNEISRLALVVLGGLGGLAGIDQFMFMF